MKVRAVLRFSTGAKMVQPGEEIEVDESLAREVINSGKAVDTTGDVIAANPDVAATAEASAESKSKGE